MKFYDCTTAPSPRRVRIFAAEKGISLPTVQVDLRNGEQFLCTPVSKDGGEVANKQDHLVCYIVEGGKNAGKKVEITNQFGKAILSIGGTVQLCVPSIKKLL